MRSFPGSRRYPQFNKDNLQSSLAANQIEYVHLPELGGRRRARPDSINMSWRNESFRGYADYMETHGFELGMSKLLDLAAQRRTAIMCAESLWWRCHRGLISDYLKAAGHTVIHILSETKTEEHSFASTARIIDGQLSYRGLLES